MEKNLDVVQFDFFFGRPLKIGRMILKGNQDIFALENSPGLQINDRWTSTPDPQGIPPGS